MKIYILININFIISIIHVHVKIIAYVTVLTDRTVLPKRLIIEIDLLFDQYATNHKGRITA